VLDDNFSSTYDAAVRGLFLVWLPIRLKWCFFRKLLFFPFSHLLLEATKFGWFCCRKWFCLHSIVFDQKIFRFSVFPVFRKFDIVWNTSRSVRLGFRLYVNVCRIICQVLCLKNCFVKFLSFFCPQAVALEIARAWLTPLTGELRWSGQHWRFINVGIKAMKYVFL